MGKESILTDIPGTPGMFWGDHSTYVGSYVPPAWLAKLAGKGLAFNLMGVVSALRLMTRRRHHPGVVTDGGASGLLFAIFQFLVPWGRKPHVMIDCLWYESSGRLSMWVKSVVRRLAARSGTRFVVWASHEVEDFARVFGIPRESLVYVPHYHSLDGYEYDIRDEGYLFAGGNGDRDYQTLIEAIRLLNIPTWIATTNQEGLRGVDLPAHVRVEGTTHAGFRRAMAGASIVVVAMHGGLLHSGGQQTCLNAMFMGKPTIAVGRKWAVDLIEDGVDGLIVDYGDVNALLTAIERLCFDAGRAAEMARKAREKAARFQSKVAMERVYGLAIGTRERQEHLQPA
jgi:glycosyltransferase involved in cell wall biosynthesis